MTEVPASFGRFLIQGCLGQGDGSVVYLARDPNDQAQVALKVLAPRQGRKQLEQLVSEARLEFERLAQLDHPNIVRVREIGVCDSSAYLVTPYVAGLPLDQVISSAQYSRAKLIDLFFSLASAVEYAHAKGLIHRDLKPENVVVSSEGHLFLLDFGLSWRKGDRGLEGTQSIVGTPSYMSPEQIRGEERRLTAASDVYSLGAILYAILTGRPPLVGETPWKTRQLVLSQKPLPPGVDPELDKVVLFCLEKDPRQRYQSVKDLVRDLQRAGRGQTPSGPSSSGLFSRLFG